MAATSAAVVPVTFEQKLAVLVGAAIALAALVECGIHGWHALMRHADRAVTRMVDDGLAILAATDTAELPDPDPFDWSAETLHAWADPFAQTRRDIAALETTEERP